MEITLDNFKIDSDAIGLLTKEKENGTIYDVDWMSSFVFKHASAQFCITKAHALLNGWSDKQVKDVWLEVEQTCDLWRRQNKVETKSGDRLKPVQLQATTKGLITFQLAKDTELFAYLNYRNDPAIRSIVERVGVKKLLAIMILYENHFDNPTDAMGTLASLCEFESLEKEPDAKRGRKVINSAKLGHQATYGTNEEKEETRAEYQKYIDDLYIRNKSLSFQEMKNRAATYFKVSAKTIQRYTSNPKKRGKDK